MIAFSPLQPQLARTQHTEGRPEKTFVFLSKMKLQRAVRDNQSSKNALVKLPLILPYPTDSDAKPRELSRVSSLQTNTVEQPITWRILTGLRTHGSLGLGSKGPYLLS